MPAKPAIADRYRPSVLPKLELLDRAGRVADAHAWSDFGWPTGDVRVDFRDDGNAIVALRDDLGGGIDVPLRFAALEFDPVRASLQMLDLVTDRAEPIADREARFYARHLEQVARATHVLVVATDRVRLPRLDVNSFEGGEVHGAALLVELATGELRGAFHYAAVNSDRISAPEAAIQGRLCDDLAARWGGALVTGIRQRFPSAVPPTTFGYVMS